MTSLEEFIENEDLKCVPIYYYIDKVSGNKKPIGEKNNATVEEINECKKKRDVNFPKPEYKTEMINGKHEKIPFSEDERASMTKAHSINLKHTDKLYCIDVDVFKIKNMEDFIAETGVQIFKNCCWVEGNTKGIHIYLKINNMIDFTNK